MAEIITRLGPALSDRYRIEREIGAGGMATVYLARDLKHDRDVALKVLRPELAAVLGAERFLNEIRISAQLDHPHILTLIDSGSADGFLYYVMPFVRGESLRTRLDREKQLGVDEALTIAQQVGSALDYAHRHGVVHRDIKPENILIHEGEATLADFGIAMAVKEAGGNRLTETGLSLGTPQYMSPEQATGDRTLDARSDVYSLAAVLYEMLAGEPPHGGATVQAIIAKLMTERPTRLRVMRDTVPEGIDSAVAKALAKVPADRYANAGEFAKALASVPIDSAALPKKRRMAPVALIAGVAAIAALAAVIATNLSRGRQPAALTTPDIVQLTTTGNATVPAMSPDGNRFAFAEKACDENGSCTYRLVIQDMDGTGRLILTEGIGTVWMVRWTRDSRYLVYSGSYGATRWGAFAISTLGGQPRRLGCCFSTVTRGDTVAVSPQPLAGDTIAWVRLVTARDGQVRDSLLIDHPGLNLLAMSADDPQMMLTYISLPEPAAPEWRLTDRKGKRLASTPVGPSLQGRSMSFDQLDGANALMLAVQRQAGSSAYDFHRLRIDGQKFVPDVDTLIRGIAMTSAWFDVAASGSSMLFQAGPYEAAVIAFDAASLNSGKIRQVLSSTTPLRGRISPDGRRIGIIQRVLVDGAARDQISLIPFAGGEPVILTPALEDINDFEWNPDGSGLVYVHRVSAEERSIAAVDTTGRVRELMRGTNGTVSGVQVLADNRVIVADPDGIGFLLIDRTGKTQAHWKVPEWSGGMTSFSGSPDGKSIAMIGWDRPFDSILVARVDVITGQFNKIAAISGEGFDRIKWTSDNRFLFDIGESSGSQMLYSMTPEGTRPQKVGTLPRFRTTYTIADDGKHVAGFTENDKSDVYMIRNLADILRRRN